MLIKSNGYERQVFERFNPTAIRIFNSKLKQQISDKKLKATFNINFRYKNNSKRTSTCNNEILSLAFDRNLSPDFVFEEVDFSTGRSLTVGLVETYQKDFGKTQLMLSVQHINEEQELFENQAYCYCETLPGTIGKRLQAYKTAFDREVEVIRKGFHQEGFQVHLKHTIDNFAGYLYHENKRRVKEEKFLSEISHKIDINKLLILFSVFHEDYFWKNVSSFNSSLHNAPYCETIHAYTPHQINRTLLPVEQVEELERLIGIKKNMNGLSNLFEKHFNHSDCKFDYYGFKAEFLELYYRTIN